MKGRSTNDSDARAAPGVTWSPTPGTREGMPPRPHLALPTPGSRRAVVVGAGSFGTAVAVLLARGGFRTTLQTRTAEQAERLEADRENKAYLEGVEFPRELRIESISEGLARADYVFLGVPSRGLDEVIAGPRRRRAGPPDAGRSRSPRASSRPTARRRR